MADHLRLASLGTTQAGSAIVDAVWHNGARSGLDQTVGVVLILNPEGLWKAYLGPITVPTDEQDDAKKVAELGQKLPWHLAAAYFPTRGITEEDYGK